MDGVPLWMNIVALFVVVNVIFHVIYLLDRRSKSEGLLFSKPPTWRSRGFAALLGIFLAAFLLTVFAAGVRPGLELGLVALASAALFGYSIGIDKPLRVLQESHAKVFNHFMRDKRLIGVQDKSIEELLSRVQSGGKFVVFEFCISPLIVTLDYDSNVHYLESDEDRSLRGLRYTAISVLLGWQSLFGPIHTLRSLVVNFRGGKDVTVEVVEWLKYVRSQQDSGARDQPKSTPNTA